jgi:TolA-binding protein
MGRFCKRLAAWSLCLVFFFSAIPVGALRALAEDGDTVYIGSVADLTYLAEKCVQDVWSEGVTVRLTTDLDLTGSDFSCIPLFSGLFDGQGHTISGFTITYSGSRQGFFRQILTGAVVQNLHLEGSVQPDGTRQNVGGIAGLNYGTIQNCSFSGSVGGTRAVGGIAGVNQSAGQILNCTVEGIVSGEHRTGGIAGENLGAISGCENNASVNTTYQSSIQTEDDDTTLEADELLSLSDAGGIAGYSSGSVADCVNNASVGYHHVGYNIGGIVGRQSGRIERCTNNGAVRGRKDVGGILGQMDPDTGWNLSTANVNALQSSLDDLQDALSGLITDLENTIDVAGSSISNALDSAKEAGDAAGTVLKDVESWANLNLSTLNDLSERVTLVLQRLGPIARTLAGASDDLSSASSSLAQVLSDASLSEEERQSVENALDQIEQLQTQTTQISGQLDDTIEDLEDENCLTNIVTTWRNLQDLPGLIGSVVSAVQGVIDLVDSVLQASGITTIAQIAAAADQLSSTLIALRNTASLLADLADELGSEPALKFALMDTDSAAQTQLFDALDDISSSISTLRKYLQNQPFDLQNVNDKTFALLDTVVDMFTGSSSDAVNYTEDISALEDEDRTSGILRNCTNYGSVIASTNVGGVTGAITLDLTFDEENQWNLSALLAQGARYLIYAAVYNCASYASVQADKSAAGGVVGRMDYGAVLACEASGQITSSGDYVGGIAGLSTGTLYDCKARAELEGDSYVGGIAGLGTNISHCYALPHIASYTEYAGSIAGSSESSGISVSVSQPIEFLGSLVEGITSSISSSSSTAILAQEGVIVENYYAESTLGGVDGFSFSGQTDSVTYEQLLMLTENDPLFSTIKVSFVAEGETILEAEVPFGGSLPDAPSMPDREGQYWVWDTVGSDAVYYSCTITGSYRNLIPSLDSGEEVPLYLVEGAFHSGQILTAQEYQPDLSALGVEEADVLATATLTVNEASGILTARMYAPDTGALYLADADGTLTKTAFTRDGRYIVFSIENGGSLVYVKTTDYSSYLTLGVSALALLAAVAALATLRKTRKGGKRPASGDDEAEE